jgi:uncharacterized protein
MMVQVDARVLGREKLERHSLPGVRFVTAAARAVLGAVIIAYRILISPLLVALFGPACRFEPSCSVYAHQALREYGVWRGGCMAASRIMRCHPLGGSGYDPVSSPARSSRGGSKIEGVLWKPGF